MFTKEWAADYQGNRIVVHHSWGPAASFKVFTAEAKLYINGAKVDSYGDLVALGKTPAMRGSIKLGDGSFKEVEVFIKSGMLSIKAKICIDGVSIAGDNF